MTTGNDSVRAGELQSLLQIKRKTEEGAIAAWNTRRQPTTEAKGVLNE